MGTILIVLLIVFLLGGGGWGFSRWRRNYFLRLKWANAIRSERLLIRKVYLERRITWQSQE
jgi:hypothetical protein